MLRLSRCSISVVHQLPKLRRRVRLPSSALKNLEDSRFFVCYDQKGNQTYRGRTGRLILFRECLKNGIVPVVIEDANRNEYLEALKDYREEKSLHKLIVLFEREQQFYLERCKYFM